jgi:hypothetical protein
MESIIDLISAACQFSDLDSCLQLCGVSGEAGQTSLVIISFVLGMLHSHPLGYGCLAHIPNLGALGLDYIFLPLEKISTDSLRRSPSYFPNLALTKWFLITFSPSPHMNC